MRLNEHLEHDCGLTFLQHACQLRRRFAKVGVAAVSLGVAAAEGGYSGGWLQQAHSDLPEVGSAAMAPLLASPDRAARSEAMDDAV